MLRPKWLKNHPKDQIFRLSNQDLEPSLWALNLNSMANQIVNTKANLIVQSKALKAKAKVVNLGTIWYRSIAVGFEIDYLEVPLKFRGQGLGHILLKGFILFCQKQKPTDSKFEIWLEVSVNNLAAAKLYAKHGFTKVHIRPKYYDDLSDAVVMTLPLNGDGAIN